jgi:uncharacterized membrane protein
VSWESNDEETEVESLFDRAVSIANSIHGVSTKLVCVTFSYNMFPYFIRLVLRFLICSLLDHDDLPFCATGG